VIRFNELDDAASFAEQLGEEQDPRVFMDVVVPGISDD
jgi:hypothetical protein